MQPFEASDDAASAPSEETVEASATVNDDERLRDLPGDDDDDMRDDELEELFGRGAGAADPIDLDAEGGGGGEDIVPCLAVPCLVVPGGPFGQL